jgi:molecular chaperone GrpE
VTAGPDGHAEGAGPEVSEETAGAADPVDEAVEAPPADEEVVDAEAQAEEPAEPTVEDQLAERTADLQRLQAEYVNYRKRVERDRAQARQQGEAAVLRSLLTVLDDVGRAEQHGELTGGFKAVADALQQALKAHRLEAFGAEGDVFDPRLHEALFAAGESADVSVTSVGPVVRTGYKVGEEVLRHAQVGVVEPASGGSAPEGDDGE